MSVTRSTKDKKDSPVALRVMSSVAAVEKELVADSTSQITDSDSQSANRAKKKKSKSPQAKAARRAASVDLSKGSRGVDTLLRNAYRSQLDMLALAATKANTMISLNGLLMSMLIISGTHLVAINGTYIIPIAIFLITCATATTFAVFAARPEISRNNYKYSDFMRDEARLLVFEEFSDLRESEYIEAMSELLSNPQRTYQSMIAHIHELGTTADKKYQHLYYSYTAFMAGTIITVGSLLVLVALRWTGVMTLA